VTEISPGVVVAPEGTSVYNPAFDVTPPELITAVVTERGVASPVNRENLARMCSGSLSEKTR
jgi:methylthioribose-1-phosphate isomerase